ncbi:MAG: hypothetical protein ACKVQR_20660, partial [Aquabacterium sp.]
MFIDGFAGLWARSLAAVVVALVTHLSAVAAAAADATARFRFDRTETLLSRDIRPQRMQLELTLDPAAPDFAGQGLLTVQVLRTAPMIELHAQQLDRGTATLLTGRRERELQVQPDAARSTWRLVPVD